LNIARGQPARVLAHRRVPGTDVLAFLKIAMNGGPRCPGRATTAPSISSRVRPRGDLPGDGAPFRRAPRNNMRVNVHAISQNPRPANGGRHGRARRPSTLGLGVVEPPQVSARRRRQHDAFGVGAGVGLACRSSTRR
jgi:hypothetical protein